MLTVGGKSYRFMVNTLAIIRFLNMGPWNTEGFVVRVEGSMDVMKVKYYTKNNLFRRI